MSPTPEAIYATYTFDSEQPLPPFSDDVNLFFVKGQVGGTKKYPACGIVARNERSETIGWALGALEESNIFSGDHLWVDPGHRRSEPLLWRRLMTDLEAQLVRLECTTIKTHPFQFGGKGPGELKLIEMYKSIGYVPEDPDEEIPIYLIKHIVTGD
ncbi:hypothetical protein ACNOYE_34705 [Nannocystaceae bacterium ST9]